MSIVDTVKAHPYITAGALIVGIVIIAMAGSSGSANTGASGSDADLQAALAQAQTNMAQISAAAGAASESTAAALEAKRIDATMNEHIAELAQTVAMAQLNTSAQVQTNHDTLSAAVANNSIAAQTSQLQITTQGSVDMAKNYTDAMVQQSKISASVQKAAIEKSCSGFFDCLF